MIKPIAHIYTDFNSKFGIPRQSGRVKSLLGKIVFLPEFKSEEFTRGIEQFSHLWVIFDFSKAHKENISPTVRPPRLGGNTRVGVFATRSPFRPNNIGLSSVKLEKLEKTQDDGVILWVSGIDILNGTPIYDVKPYIPYTDCHQDAIGGFSDTEKDHSLRVEFKSDIENILNEYQKECVIGCISDDPRPSYQDDNREYSMQFSQSDIHFTVSDGIATVFKIDKL